jgi:hypothetical protein
VEKQKNRSDHPGLTVVGYIPDSERGPFREAISRLSALDQQFCPFEKLHFTILGLFAGERSIPPETLAELISAIHDFFEHYRLGELTVQFDLLRPGIFVGQEGCGDGTVVTMAEEAVEEKIVECSKRLAVELADKFPDYFPEVKRKPLRGVWCTLGYFCGPDFAIDDPVYKAFEALKTFRVTVHVREIAITKFTLKSLANGFARGIVSL